MLSVFRLHLPSDIPVVGCELNPYVLLRRPDNTLITDEIPTDGYYLRYKWQITLNYNVGRYRVQTDKKVPICSVHPSKEATLQCVGCVKAKLPVAKSYHCSEKCFSDSWRHHRALHARSTDTVRENGAEDDELLGRFGGSVSGVLATGGTVGPIYNTGIQGAGLNNGSVFSRPANTTEGAGGETWYEVGCSKTYTPTIDDVGHVLKLECVSLDVTTGLSFAPAITLITGCVIPAPSPTPRCLIPVNGLEGNLELGIYNAVSGNFTVLSYNVLADLYATNEIYTYCPPWALSWPYRRQNLLREIIGYDADIVCLQEVQSDHFEDFFAPEFEKNGYAAVYKKKTTEVYTRSTYVIDGCATFFRRERFSLVKKYEVEFNKAAQSVAEVLVPTGQKTGAFHRLLKDNVALIVVLEAKDINPGSSAKSQLLCVANTHIISNPELKDVKLWQVHTLLKGLEKIALSADIPMLVCGDFNSTPGSAPHELLATGRVEPSHPELTTDPLGILHPASKLCHKLPLVSAYSSSFTRMVGGGSGLDRQRKRMDPATNEPLFTNCTRDFIGTLDYIFYTADSLKVESLLELLDEGIIRKDTALPSPEWSSDHTALLAEFSCKPRPRR